MGPLSYLILIGETAFFSLLLAGALTIAAMRTPRTATFLGAILFIIAGVGFAYSALSETTQVAARANLCAISTILALGAGLFLLFRIRH
jgi:hypothetical protein